MSDETAVWLVWEGTDLRGVYANTQAGRMAAERERARIQGEYDRIDREAGREPRRRHFIEARLTRVQTGESGDD